MGKEWLKGEINGKRKGAKRVRHGNRGKFITLDTMKGRHLIYVGSGQVVDPEGA
jgi:hypothetical protein